MSLSYLNHSPISCLSAALSLNTIPLFCLVLGMVKFYLLWVLLKLVRRIYMFFSTTWSSIQSQLGFFDDLKPQMSKKNQEFVKTGDGHLCREDVEVLMTKLGIFCHPADGEKIQDRLSSQDFSSLFEEEEPSLDEVKGAFDVFDENGDGFIDARELRRVLCVLGLKEGSEMEKCRRMIASFDRNGDGRIDFNEFVKFMESSLC